MKSLFLRSAMFPTLLSFIHAMYTVTLLVCNILVHIQSHTGMHVVTHLMEEHFMLLYCEIDGEESWIK